jgi:hypothetical protein
VSERTLVGHAHAFLGVAEEHVAAAQDKTIDGAVDGMMAVIALQNAVVGAAKVLGKEHPQVVKCLSTVADLKNMRDMFMHFDDYALGTGRMQRSNAGAEGSFGWQAFWNSPATLVILVRGRGELMPTQCSIELDHALLAVAALVRAAVESIHIVASPLLERLASAGGAPDQHLTDVSTAKHR